MASDLLAKISGEIDDRLREMRPLVLEYERLVTAAQSLSAGASVANGRAGKTAGARRAPARSLARKRRPISAAAQAVLEALDHGSHTVSELVMVTAIAAGEIRMGVRRLLAAGLIVKTERDGKAAYALASPPGAAAPSV